jgi:hypothetical protein
MFVPEAFSRHERTRQHYPDRAAGRNSIRAGSRSTLTANGIRYTVISLPALGLVVPTKTELPQGAAGGSQATAPL